MEDKKHELSAHVEKIFKQYVHPGLYICDLATGVVVASHIPLVSSLVSIIPSILNASSFCVFRTS